MDGPYGRRDLAAVEWPTPGKENAWHQDVLVVTDAARLGVDVSPSRV
jgi:hypothetical protein